MPVNPKSLKNLKSVKPGQVLNPKGRGDSLNRETVFKKWGTMPAKVEHPETGEEMQGDLMDKLVISLFNTAIEDNNVAAAKEILDSVYGKIIEKNEHTHKFGLDAEEEYID